MRKLLLLCLCAFMGVAARAQNCDPCPRPVVALYDCRVDVPRPANADSLAGWSKLFWAGVWARDNLFYQDRMKDCVKWQRVTIVSISNQLDSLFAIGPQKMVLPPEGPVASADYLLTGFVTGEGGRYKLTVTLEAGPSREVIRTVDALFDANLQSAAEAGIAASEAMMPLFDNIRDFELDRRNSDENIAIGEKWMTGNDEEISLKPEKTKVGKGDTVRVEVTITDCDGRPLGHRRILFNDTVVRWKNPDVDLPLKGTQGGEIMPAVVYTDKDGKATVQFKAGNVSGPATIRAWYPHLKPCGKSGLLHGEALIQIESPPSNLWRMNALIINKYSFVRDTVISFSLGGIAGVEDRSVNIERNSIAAVTAIIENMAEDPEKGFYYTSDLVEPVSEMVMGFGYMDDFSRLWETIGGTLIRADIRNDNVRGIAQPGAGMQIEYSAEYRYFGVGVGIKGVGSYHGHHWYSNEWSEYGGTYDDYGLGCSGGGNEENGCTIVKTGNGYQVTWKLDEAVDEPSLEGTGHIIRKKSMEATLVPYDPNTLSKEENEQLFPVTASLRQNYPNPFRSETSITFQLDKREHVELVILDLLGNTVAVLADATTPQGTYTLRWDASQVPPGIYFCRMRAGSFTAARQLVHYK